jgi:putative acetyltransferase
VLGFSSHRAEDNQHRTAVYVAGHAARQGVGSALYREAEAAARQNGASEIHVAASLAAVDFYRSNGFLELNRGQHRLSSGVTMGCVFMRKLLRGGLRG